MNLALHNLQHAALLDRTTPAFTATLVVNGIERGTVRNDGSGGANYYTDRDVEREINAYAATLPPAEFEGLQVPETAETLIFGLVYDAAEYKAADEYLTEEWQGEITTPAPRPTAKRPFHPETNPRFVWNIGAIAEEYPDMPEQDDENNTVLIDRASGTPVLTLHNPWTQAICLETLPNGAPFEALAHWFNHLSPEALESENLPVASRQ